MKQFNKNLNKLLNESQYEWSDYDDFDPNRGGYIYFHNVVVDNGVAYYNITSNYDDDLNRMVPKDKEDLLSLLQSQIDDLGSELQKAITMYREVADTERFELNTDM